MRNPRKVIITIEAETVIGLPALRNRELWGWSPFDKRRIPISRDEITQISVQAVQPPKRRMTLAKRGKRKTSAALGAGTK